MSEPPEESPQSLPPPQDPHPEVDQLLADSLAAHNAAKLLRQQKHFNLARAKLEEAATLRRQAHEADPAHESFAWAAEDPVTAAGKTTHDEMMRFYEQQGV